MTKEQDDYISTDWHVDQEDMDPVEVVNDEYGSMIRHLVRFFLNLERRRFLN